MNSKNQKMTGIEKIAILMNVLGKETSLEFMKEMKDADLRLVLKVMGTMKKAPLSLINQVLKEFLEKLSEKDTIIFDENLSDPELIMKGLGEKRAQQIFGTMKNVNLLNRKGLTVLEHIDTKSLIEFLQEEHPQTIALVLAHLETDQQIKAVKLLPESIRTEVVIRMANLVYVDPERVQELDQMLKREFSRKVEGGGSQFGGVAAVAELINSLDRKTMNSLMTRLEDNDPILSKELKQYIFSFADIVKIDVRGIQAVLREVDNNKLTLALKSASDELKEKIMSAMSERAAAMLKDDLEAMSPQKVSDVEKAQREIVGIVQKLEKEGKLVISAGEESDLV
ncbi:MAG: flagellar motor switch protein FliG [Deltaproteobacteria bacterium]|nr:flagellar motor switch protein FliG [Deltaproteobacteria bacterium]